MTPIIRQGDHLVDDADMPVCPVCDNAIDAHEVSVIVIAHGCQALMHEFCSGLDAENDNEDDD